MAVTGAGLEGIVAAESQICYIDGDAGILSYQGFNIHTLAQKATFEETVYLLWHGKLPKQSELDELKGALVANRAIPAEVEAFLKSVRQVRRWMCCGRRYRCCRSTIRWRATTSQARPAQKAVKLMAQTATIVTSFDRLRKGQPVVAGDPALGFAANFLYTLTGKKPDDVMARTFDIALTLHAEHELNASTFAARVTAATLSDIYSAVTAAIGALRGPLHGGANEDAIKMLLEAGTADKAIENVKYRLANKIKVPAFGHRVYHTVDPRATHLAELSEEVGKRTGHLDLYQTSKLIEQYMKNSKNLNANVDFYSASMYYSLGLPIDLFTPLFAVSRMSGWTAHVLEQYHNNRLIRPRADYTGLAVGQKWVPIGRAG